MGVAITVLSVLNAAASSEHHLLWSGKPTLRLVLLRVMICEKEYSSQYVLDSHNVLVKTYFKSQWLDQIWDL